MSFASGMKLTPLRETEEIGGDKSMNLFSQRRTRNYDDDDDCCFISDHFMILLGILPFKFSNSRVHRNE